LNCLSDTGQQKLLCFTAAHCLLLRKSIEWSENIVAAAQSGLNHTKAATFAVALATSRSCLHNTTRPRLLIVVKQSASQKQQNYYLAVWARSDCE